jgi:hypothetical protein
MALESTYGTMSTLIGNVYDIALFAAAESNVMAPLVTVKGDLSDSRPRVWSTYSGGTFAAIDENTDGTALAFHATAAGTLTPSLYYQQIFLTDKRIRTDPMGAQADAGQHLGNSLGESVDTQLAGLFDSLTGGTVGAGSVALNFKYIMHAQAKMRTNKIPGPYICVLSPVQWYYMTGGTADVPTLLQNNQMFMDSVIRPFYQGSYSGVDFLVDANITAGSASVGGMFHRQAIALDIRNPFTIEPQRDASRGGGGIELNGRMEYAYGVMRPTWGVAIEGMGTA